MFGVSLEYLRGLGIDVWTHKQTAENVEESRAAPLIGKPKIRQSRNEATPLVADAVVRPNFTIRGFRLERVFALVSEEALPDMSLIHNIAWAINRFKSIESDDFDFVWPQVEGSETSWDDAIHAFNAFCQFRVRAEDVVLTVGEDVAKLLTRKNLSTDQVIALDSAPHDATAKHELWRQIQVLAP